MGQALNTLSSLVAALLPDPVIINHITKVFYHFISQDVANLKSQISDCQVNVQMENKNSPDLNDTISNIRTQYERAVQKSREETEAWYQNKVSGILHSFVVSLCFSKLLALSINTLLFGVPLQGTFFVGTII